MENFWTLKKSENFLNLTILMLIFVQVIFCHINVKYFIQKTVDDIEGCDGQTFFGFEWNFELSAIVSYIYSQGGIRRLDLLFVIIPIYETFEHACKDKLLRTYCS